jgi:SAM-dependent methyltransferase
MRWAVVRNLVRSLAPRSVLEIGCGQGGFGARLVPLSQQYLAVEPDAASFAVARGRIESVGGRVLNASVEELEGNQTFDLVCAFEVLEHIADDSAALRSWYDRCAPGGHILLSMPAWQERFNKWDEMAGHYRRYSPQQCRALLADVGFEDVEVVAYGWPLGYATEKVRSVIAARRAAATANLEAAAIEERTAASGRVFQPRSTVGRLVEAATAPFVQLQRLHPERGTGVVVLARRPGGPTAR